MRKKIFLNIKKNVANKNLLAIVMQDLVMGA